MKTLNMVVQGKQVNSSVIAAYGKRFNSMDEVVSRWANAACLQLALHSNRNWLDNLFNTRPLRLQNGQLSKLGDEVLAYIKAYYPLVKFDKETTNMGWKRPAPGSMMETHFIDPTITEETKDSAGGDFAAYRDKFYRPHGDFSLTFSQWKEWRASLAGNEGDPDESVPQVSASQFIKQAEKALAALTATRFTGVAEDLATAMLKAGEVFEALKALAAAAQPVAEPIDTDAAVKLLDSGRKGKSARAGGKVAPATKEAV